MPEEYPFHPYRSRQKVTINIDATTLKADETYLKSIVGAIEAQIPFVLHYDGDSFMVALPALKTVICFSSGIPGTVERFMGDQEFIDRVKLGMVVYDKFSTVEDFYKDIPALKDVYLLSR